MFVGPRGRDGPASERQGRNEIQTEIVVVRHRHLTKVCVFGFLESLSTHEPCASHVRAFRVRVSLIAGISKRAQNCIFEVVVARLTDQAA